MVRSTDIVAYTGNAESLCPPCAARSVGWDGAGNPHTYIETAGVASGINVHDERSFDSSDWPKVIFHSQLEYADERCGHCGESFIG
jgi:hypothetical protein